MVRQRCEFYLRFSILLSPIASELIKLRSVYVPVGNSNSLHACGRCTQVPSYETDVMALVPTPGLTALNMLVHFISTDVKAMESLPTETVPCSRYVYTVKLHFILLFEALIELMTAE